MRKPLQNIGASGRARLLNLAKERNQPFELLFIRYTLERLLYRLSKSKHRNANNLWIFRLVCDLKDGSWRTAAVD
jgi:hypothetical protein